jgi:GH25 family lysozyme M1 (1,4-beta-N-acetylmuramidase)
METIMKATSCLGALSALTLIISACAPSDPSTQGGEDHDIVDEQLTVCAAGATLKGIDVSEFQGNVDWVKVKASGRSFAFARVSDGVTHPDATFSGNWSGMKAAGLTRGVYQYFRPGQDAIAQADLLVSKIGTFGAGDLPPVIDVETANGQSNSVVVSGVRAWIDRVKAKTGRDPIIYAAAGFWDSLSNTSQFAPQKLWVANYGQACPYLPGTWGKWSFWQDSDAGAVSGVSGGVDTSLFNGTSADLAALAQASGPAASGCKSDVECNHGSPGAGVICSNNGTSASKCIDGCHSDDDCSSGASCDKTLAHWQCTSAPPALGTACTTDTFCAGGKAGSSRVCSANSKTCALGCHTTATDCPASTTCDKSGAAWVCAPALLPVGAACTTDAQCGLPGQEKVCGASSHVCTAGCHLDSDCSSSKSCDHAQSPWQCSAAAPAPDPSGCPVLTYPSGVKIQTVKNAAMTASYTGHLKSGQAAPLCFLDVSNLRNPVTNEKYPISVNVAAHFQLSELVGTEVDQGWGNFVLLNPKTVASLEAFRVSAGVSVSVNSGFRGPKHQESVCIGICGDPLGCSGTCSNSSRHMWGDAVDLPLDFYTSTYSNLACDGGFNYTYLEAGTHLHVDQNPAYAGQCIQD